MRDKIRKLEVRAIYQDSVSRRDFEGLAVLTSESSTDEDEHFVDCEVQFLGDSQQVSRKVDLRKDRYTILVIDSEGEIVAGESVELDEIEKQEIVSEIGRISKEHSERTKARREEL